MGWGHLPENTRHLPLKTSGECPAPIDRGASLERRVQELQRPPLAEVDVRRQKHDATTPWPSTHSTRDFPSMMVPPRS